jgi:predicted esterase YcpF (UPF0227 family)
MNGLRWRGWLAAVAIFLLGVGLGGAGATWVGMRIVRNAILNPSRPHSLADRAAERIGADLTKNLQLTPEQSAQVQSVLAQSATNLKAMRVQVATQTRNEMRSAAKQIAALLPPEKRAEFYRLMAKRYDRLGLTAPAPGENP